MKRYAYTIIIFASIITGCTNPFSTRTPEPPLPVGGDTRSNRLQTDPDSLLSKFRYAFVIKNSTYYDECLSDSLQVGMPFVFVAEKNESFRLTNWSRQDEINYFNNLINNKNLKSISVEFTNQTPWNVSSTSTDTLQTQFSYRIQLQFRTKKEIYQGRSVLKIFRSSLSQWYIFYWEDFHLQTNSTDSTWTTLKANYRYN